MDLTRRYTMLKSCKLIIKDEVNITFQGLDLEARRKLANKFKYEIPWARYQASYRLGRWDGTKSFFTIGGTGYINQLDQVLPMLEDMDYDVEVEDHREPVEINFTPIDKNFLSDKTWPKGHQFEGQPIVLLDHQVDVINQFLQNPQALQEVATSAGKTIITAALCKITEALGKTITIVPNKSLVEQTEEDFRNIGLDVGVYYGDRKELNKTHTICTWQSLNVLDKKKHDDLASVKILENLLLNVKTVIVDECFDGNTLITTPQGKIPIKDLKEGDKVINLCEKTKKFKEDTIVKVHKNLAYTQNEKMLELEFDNGQKIQVTANHKFLTNNGWIRADELTEDLEIININTYS